MTDTVYIGVVEGDYEYGECRDSIGRIRQRPGDEGPVYGRATKGYENREKHIQRFLASNHSAILLLDGDMWFPEDALERLRSHNLPFVSGLYMRRHLAPVAPVWFEPFSGAWPMTPWMQPIEPGRLYELGASGWGCMYIRREVFEAMRPILKGEAFVLEDDMDLWPYDLPKVMNAVKTLRIALDEGILTSSTRRQLIEDATEALEAELRPIRGSKHDCIGSDIRFPFYARAAGYTLYGDPDVSCYHSIVYPVSALDYRNQGDEYREQVRQKMAHELDEEAARVRKALEVLGE